MKLSVPFGGQWSVAFQHLFNGELERAFNALNPSAQVPGAGAVGQVLVKNSARPYDLAWGPAIIQGSGVPSASAPEGTLYINTTAGTASTRLYIRTDTAWASFTASA